MFDNDAPGHLNLLQLDNGTKTCLGVMHLIIWDSVSSDRNYVKSIFTAFDNSSTETVIICLAPGYFDEVVL